MLYDYCIVGGGIVGLATAMDLLEKHPGASLILIEKEDRFAAHQTGHNSGVIHAGIYYAPGSLKATLCRQGLEATYAFCQEHGIKTERCGKLIVATNAEEDARVEALYERATANGLNLERIAGPELNEREPRITGTSGLLSPDTGIVDYKLVSAKMAEVIKSRGAEIALETEIDRIVEKPDHVEIGAKDTTWQARKLVVCGGLQADRLAQLAGLDVDFRIVPFRGEYYRLPPEKNDVVQHLIYPAPDPSMPFLGVHLTRMIDGSVTVGPNAVMGLAREGYPKLSVNLRDMFSFATFEGFWKLVWQNRKHAAHELYASLWKPAYLEECRKYCPELTLSDLGPYPSGIRAQLVTKDGTPVHDFMFRETDRMLHVCNAPSPAATSSIPIGKMIAEKVGAPGN